MDVEDQFRLDVEVPFPNKLLSEIAYHVLRVEAEPKRSGVVKTLSFTNNILQVSLTAPSARQLRVAVTALFDNIRLIGETIEFAGEPCCESYSHFN